MRNIREPYQIKRLIQMQPHVFDYPENAVAVILYGSGLH